MLYYIGGGLEEMNKCSIKECVEYLKDVYEIGLDIETKRKYSKGTYNEDIYSPGLDPYFTEICMLQIGDEIHQYVIDVRTEDISPLFPILNNEKKLFVGSNLKFEAKHLKHNFNINLWNIWDCMLVDIILTNGLNLGYSVEKMAERYLGIKSSKSNDLFNQLEEDEEFIDKSVRMQFIEIGDSLFTQKQIQYGADDILIPLRIKKEQQKSEYFPEECIKLENSFCMVLADIELRGISFSPEKWLEVAASKKVEYDSRLDKMNKWVIAAHHSFCTPPDLFSTEYICNIMWSSSTQVVKFFRMLGFCPKEKSKQTKKMEYSVGAKALFKPLPSNYKEFYMNNVETEIETNNDVILNYLLLKKSEQAITTFGEDFLKYIHPITGKIHSNYKQILNTGRIASSKPNVQNIPSEVEYRKAFIASDGCKIINADYSSQESRVLAEVCQDEDMLSFFNNGHEIFGDDYHSFTATKMFRIIRNDDSLIVSKKTHPKERQGAKAIGFKIAYGGSAYTLKDDFGVSEEIAQEFIDGYFEAFPSLLADFEKAKENALKLGYIEIDGITGRRWWWKEFEYIKELHKKIWSLFPDNYRQFSKEKKLITKEKVNKEHPEIKEMWSEYFSLRGKVERNALNYRIQGLAGSQTKKAGVLFREYQIKNDLENQIWITNLIHDECLAESKEDFVEEGMKIIQNSMEKGAQYFCKSIKMKAEAVENIFWGH